MASSRENGCYATLTMKTKGNKSILSAEKENSQGI
jgi:hypothetical protein